MAVALDDYRPFDSGPGSMNHAADWRKWMNRTHQSGVIASHKEPSTANEFEPYADSTGMQVKIRPGECYVQGHWGELQFEKTMAIPAAHATLTRIDRVVLRGDYDAESITVEVLTGTPGSGQPPALTQNTSRWEVRIAQVTVDPAVVTIAAGKVFDERQRGGLGMTSAHHVPDLRYSVGNGAVNIGTGGTPTKLCRYKLEGKVLYIRWYFKWGTSGFNGGTGQITTNLPDGMVARGEHWLTSHLWTHSPTDRNWIGQSLIWDNDTKVQPYFPRSLTEMRTWPYCIGSGGGYTQCPFLPGGSEYPEGGELIICGMMEIK